MSWQPQHQQHAADLHHLRHQQQQHQLVLNRTRYTSPIFESYLSDGRQSIASNSDTSSSAAELATIIQRAGAGVINTANNCHFVAHPEEDEYQIFVPLKSNYTYYVRSRRQHNLRSIYEQQSRSRSPIVVVSPPESNQIHLSPSHSRLLDLDNHYRFSNMQPVVTGASQQRPQVAPRVTQPNNPFDPTSQYVSLGQPAPQSLAINRNTSLPSLANHQVPLVEPLIHPDSFERRRSVYEAELNRVRCSRNASLRSTPGNVVADELDGLDEILAKLQAEQPPSMEMPSHLGGDVNFIANVPPQPPAEQTELQEFNPNLLQTTTNSQFIPTTLRVARSSSSSSEASAVRRSREQMAEKRRKYEIASGFEIAWLDFTYTVGPNFFENPRWGKINSLFHKEHRQILKGLSGGLKSGQMVALMGPSGAGKTCLLESISGVRTDGIGGRMIIRGRKKAQLVIVPQYDDFMPQFTVEETIIYGSRMKNGFSTNHRKVADTVIEQLGLQVCRSNNIQRCSGGQRKRVAIAQELVSRPNILILDEPTSGLDSSCCYHTMKVLRDVLDQSVKTEQPMAIVSTIHQPSAKVFKMFDLVYLLGKTGYMAYSGPPDDLVPTIREVTGLECPQYSNPSDFMIELVAYDYGEAPVEKLIEFERKKATQYVKDFDKRCKMKGTNIKTSISNGQKQVANLADEKLAHVQYKSNINTPLRKATSNEGRRHPFFWHTWIHLHRSFLQSIRDPILNNMRILIHLGFASLLVLLYGKKSGEARGCPPVLGLPIEITDPHNESMIDLADNVGYLFMCIMMITYVSLMSTVLTFPIDIKTVGKEYKNGWYGTITYFLGKTMADMPFIILYPVAYCLITWYITNQAQDHAWRYFSFTGLIIMNAMNSQSFGLILGALFVNSVTAATFLGPVITIPWYLFTGFTKRVHRLTEPFKSTSKLLFTRYVFEGILDTVYGHERCNCSEFLEKYYELRFEEANRLGQLISMETLSSLDYYDGIETIAPNDTVLSTLSSSSSKGSNWFEKTFDAASTVFGDGENLNLANLMDSNVKASSLFSFGLDFEPTCPKDYESFIVQDFKLGEKNAEKAFVTVLIMLVVIRVVTFILVAWKIRTRQL